MRNLHQILPLMSKLSGKFHRFSAIDGSIEMLKNGSISKNSIKMKNFKLFCEAQTVSHLKKITHISLPHQVKASNISGTKISIQKFTRIYRHLLSKCFENPVRRHLEMVQCKCLFLTPTRNMLAGKFEKWVRFLTVLREYTFYNDE